MTSEEYARVQDLARMDMARLLLRELETIDGDALAANLREPIAKLKSGIKLRAERADAGESRKSREDRQGKLT